MNTLIDYIDDIVGTWNPIDDVTSHFYGIDFHYLIAGAVLITVLVGFFNLVRAIVRS